MNAIFCDVFDDDSIKIFNGMTAEDVEEWDSVQHIRLVLAIEEVFSIQFSTTEVVDMLVVGDLADCIESKLKG